MKVYINGDCMEGMKEYNEKFFDLALVDPPYGIKGLNNSGRIKNISSVKEWNKKPGKDYFKELFRVSKYQIIFGANNFELPPTEYFLIWHKMQSVDNFSDAEYAWTNIKIPAKVFSYSFAKNNAKDKIHPTQKPVDLYRWILKKYAKIGYKILDTHVGSASSLIACEMEKFDYTGFEKDKKMYDKSLKRLKNFRQSPTFL